MLTFRRAMYGTGSILANPAYVRWMFEEAPRGSSKAPRLWLFKKDGRIEGQQGAFGVRLKIGDMLVPALWATELMVHPAQQLRGIGAVLAQVAFEETRLTLGLEVSEDARKAFLKAGWIDAGTVPLYFRPFDLGALLAARWRRRGMREIGQIPSALLRAHDGLRSALAQLGGTRFEEVQAFDPRIDALWEKASRHYPVICRRDRESLTWRFLRYPIPDRYRCFELSRRAELIGYAVLRMGESHGLPSGHIVDFLCEPRWTGTLLTYCLRALRESGAAAAYCLHLNPLGTGALRRLGFIRRDSGWRLMLRQEILAPEALRLVGDPSRWFLTAADSNVDRPREGTVFINTHWKRPSAPSACAEAAAV